MIWPCLKYFLNQSEGDGITKDGRTWVLRAWLLCWLCFLQHLGQGQDQLRAGCEWWKRACQRSWGILQPKVSDLMLGVHCCWPRWRVNFDMGCQRRMNPERTLETYFPGRNHDILPNLLILFCWHVWGLALAPRATSKCMGGLKHLDLFQKMDQCVCSVLGDPFVGSLMDNRPSLTPLASASVVNASCRQCLSLPL